MYQVEYEPESAVDTEVDEKPNIKGKKKRRSATFSDSDTDLDDVTFFAVTATVFELADDTDAAEWADSSDTEASDSGIEAPAIASKDHNPLDLRASSDESVDTSARPLKCISCNQPDEYLHPLMKECHGCWQVMCSAPKVGE